MNDKYLILFRTLFKEMRSALPKPPNKEMRLDNISQWMVLHYLFENREEEITQKDIENAIHRSRATVSGIIDTLEKRGMVIRNISKTDKRKKVITLCPKVLENCSMARRRFEEAELVLLKGIPNEDLEVFDRVIEQMIQNLKEENSHV